MINVDNARAYFREHTQGAQWREYSVEQQTAAIAHAKRELARALRRPMREDEGQYIEGEQCRDEYAVYEQALYTLLRDAMPSGSGSATPSLNPDETADARRTHSEGRNPWSRAALAWLGEIRAPQVAMG